MAIIIPTMEFNDVVAHDRARAEGNNKNECETASSFHVKMSGGRAERLTVVLSRRCLSIRYKGRPTYIFKIQTVFSLLCVIVIVCIICLCSRANG